MEEKRREKFNIFVGDLTFRVAYRLNKSATNNLIPNMTTTELDFLLQISTQTRQNMQGMMQRFTAEQINAIPPGFNNNLAWNFAHVIVTQQLLCYSLSGLKPTVSADLIEQYRKGSSPQGFVDQGTLDEWYALGQTSVDQIRQDYQNGLFENFKTYPTSYGIQLHSIDEALQFNAAHEALHLGTVMAMQRSL